MLRHGNSSTKNVTMSVASKLKWSPRFFYGRPPKPRFKNAVYLSMTLSTFHGSVDSTGYWAGRPRDRLEQSCSHTKLSVLNNNRKAFGSISENKAINILIEAGLSGWTRTVAPHHAPEVSGQISRRGHKFLPTLRYPRLSLFDYQRPFMAVFFK